MSKLLNLIQKIAERPEMYVSAVRMDLVRAHLSGYENGFGDCGELEEKYSLSAFTDWLRKSTGKGDDQWWDSLLVGMHGSEEAAIRALPAEYARFVGETGK